MPHNKHPMHAACMGIWGRIPPGCLCAFDTHAIKRVASVFRKGFNKEKEAIKEQKSRYRPIPSVRVNRR